MKNQKIKLFIVIISFIFEFNISTYGYVPDGYVTENQIAGTSFFSETGYNTSISSFLPSLFHSYIFNPTNLMSPSPKAFNFSIYGNVDIDKYNGLLNLDVDILNYSDNDFRIPITFKYVSTAFKPSVRPSLLGENWILNCGGIITRKVVGKPDDTRGDRTVYYNASNIRIDTTCRTGLFYAKKKHTAFHSYNNESLWNLNILEMAFYHRNPYNAKDNFDYDLEPDIFKFTLPDCSGSFIINSNGEPELLDNKNCKVLIDELAPQVNNYSTLPNSSKIKIITDNGLVYTFGGDTSSLEYLYPIPKAKYPTPPRHITAWYLSSINAPNGRKIVLTYHNQLQKNKYHYMGCSNSRTDYHVTPQKKYNYVGLEIDYIDDTRTPPDTFYFNTKLYREQFTTYPYEYNYFQKSNKYSDSTIFEEQIHSPILDKISVDDKSIVFGYEFSQLGFYDNADLNDRTVCLKSIKLYNGSDLLHQTILTHQYKNDYFFLKTINNNGKNYSFEYDLRLNLPKPLVTSTDHWGYWNDSLNTTNTILTEKVESYLNNVNTRKAVNPQLADIGLLKKITYPTGGSTFIEYECNKYKFYYDYTTSMDLEKMTSSTLQYCGGARVLRVKDFDNIKNSFYNSRVFYYKDSRNGQETGLLNLTPKYKTTDYFSSFYELIYDECEFCDSLDYRWQLPMRYYTYCENLIDFKLDIYYKNNEMSSNNLGGNTPFTEYHISYPDVIEVFEYNDGYNKYHYSSKVDNPDFYDVNRYVNRFLDLTPDNDSKTDAFNHGYYMKNDFSHFRGKLLGVYSYDSNNTLSSSSEYTYNNLNAVSSYQVAVTSKSRGCCAYKIYTTPCQLLSEKSTDKNGVNTIVNYTYNSRGLISEKSTLNSTGNKESIFFKYPTDYSTYLYHDDSVAIKSLISKNIIAEPVELSTNIDVNGISMSNGGLLNKYKYFKNVGFPLKSSQFLLSSNTLINTFSSDFYSNLSEETKYLNYDVYGNPRSIETKSGQNTVFIWDIANKYPIAKLENAKMNGILYDSAVYTGSISHTWKPLLGSIFLPVKTKIKLISLYKHRNLLSELSSILDPNLEMIILNSSNIIVWSTNRGINSEKRYMDFLTLESGSYTMQIRKKSLMGYSDVNADIIATPIDNYTYPFYTSFEDDSIYINQFAKTGSKCHSGTYDIYMPIFSSSDTPVLLSFWGKTSASSDWTYVEETITSNSVKSRTIGQGYAYIDEVRLYPKGAMMTTYTYAPFKGMTSQTNPNNITTFYEYDSKNRLEYIRDNEGKIINKYEYHFQNQE